MFTCSSLIHFELVFVKGVKPVSRICVCVGWGGVSVCLVVPESFIEKTVLSPLNCLYFLSTSVNYIYVGLCLGSAFCSIDLFVCSSAGTTLH